MGTKTTVMGTVTIVIPSAHLIIADVLTVVTAAVVMVKVTSRRLSPTKVAVDDTNAESANMT